MMKPVDGLMKLVKTTISSVFIIKNIEKEWSFCYFFFLTLVKAFELQKMERRCVCVPEEERGLGVEVRVERNGLEAALHCCC